MPDAWGTRRRRGKKYSCWGWWPSCGGATAGRPAAAAVHQSMPRSHNSSPAAYSTHCDAGWPCGADEEGAEPTPATGLPCVKKDSLFAAARGRQQVVVVHGRGERERTLGWTVSVTLPRTPLRWQRPARTTDRTLHPHTQPLRTAPLPLGGPRVAICISAWY